MMHVTYYLLEKRPGKKAKHRAAKALLGFSRFGFAFACTISGAITAQAARCRRRDPDR